MNKAILASTLFTALLIGASANADMAGDLDDSVQTSSVEIQKVSFDSPAADYEIDVNR